MSLWNTLFGWLWSSDTDTASAATDSSPVTSEHCVTNPATGLPMVGGCGGVDVAGSPYGTDVHAHHMSHSGWHDSNSGNDSWADNGTWSDSSSGWDH